MTYGEIKKFWWCKHSIEDRGMLRERTSEVAILLGGEKFPVVTVAGMRAEYEIDEEDSALHFIVNSHNSARDKIVSDGDDGLAIVYIDRPIVRTKDTKFDSQGRATHREGQKSSRFALVKESLCIENNIPRII